ncbi:hypothetical protein SUGI_0638760 [Cryptomeria japonica]|nr:hypothetical protein SUGI_0638760 [Cryptomeria japonica]
MQSKVFSETEKQLIKVMRMDGKMLEYSPPLVVRDLLMENGYQQNFMVVHSEKVGDGLPMDYKLVGGELYYLIPSHIGADQKGFSAQRSCACGGKERVEDVGSSCGGAVKTEIGMRIKILVSKKQLKDLLSNGYLKEKVVDELLVKQFESKALHQGASFVPTREWRPCLERIPEVD